MIRNLTLAAAVVGVGAYAVLSRQMSRRPEPLQPLQTPAIAPFTHSVGGLGIVEALGDNVLVDSIVSGVVDKIHVQLGQRVRVGDLLFTVENSEQQALVESRKAEVAVLEAGVLVAEDKLNERKDIAARQARLREEKVNTVAESTMAEFAFQASEAQRLQAQAELRYGKTRLEAAQTALERTRVKAPRGGEILGLNIREGEYVQPPFKGGALVLGETRTLQVRVDFDEGNVSRVRPTAKALAYTRDDRRQEIPLDFLYIEPVLVPKKSLTGDPSERVDTRVLQAVYSFKPPSDPVYVGQLLDVFIDAGTTSPAPAASTNAATLKP
jgi:HlyD family secretion protein